MGKLAEIRQLKEKVDALLAESPDILHIDDIQGEIARKQLLIYEEQNAGKEKSKGNLIIALGFVLIIAEILLVLFHSPFEIIDAVIIGAVFFWGLKRKLAGMKEYKRIVANHHLVVDAEQRIQQLNAQLEQLESASEEYEQLCDQLEFLLQYTGKKWDLETTTVNAATCRQLEKDMADLMACLAYTEDSQFLWENWFCLGRVVAVTNKFNQNNAAIAKNDAMLNQLQNSGSWILNATAMIMLVMDMEIMRRGIPNQGNTYEEEMNLEKGKALAKISDPSTDEEKEFYAAAQIAVPRALDELVAQLIARR